MPEDRTYAVWGGTARLDTYYSPNNFGVHGHEADEGPYSDDSARVCRDPGRVSERNERGYRDLLDRFQEVNSYEVFLESP